MIMQFPDVFSVLSNKQEMVLHLVGDHIESFYINKIEAAYDGKTSIEIICYNKDIQRKILEMLTP